MSESVTVRQPLRWASFTRRDGMTIQQALARNNSWYMIVPAADGSFEARYASQSGNFLLAATADIETAKRAADEHADRYDTRV